jgi:hypothetical protein
MLFQVDNKEEVEKKNVFKFSFLILRMIEKIKKKKKLKFHRLVIQKFEKS